MLKEASGAFIQLLQFNLMYFFKRAGSLSTISPPKSLPVHKSSCRNRSRFQPPAFGSARQTFPSLPSQPKDKVQHSFHSPAPPSTILIKTSQRQSPSLVCRSYESCQPSPFYTQEQELWLFLFNAPPAGAAARD